MAGPDNEGFQKRRREADERVQRKNREDLGVSNVVPLRRPEPKRELRLSRLAFNPLVLWAAIIVLLIAVYLVQQAL